MVTGNGALNGDNSPGARVGYAVTTLIKLGGLAIAIREGLFVDPPRDGIVFAIAAFMMAGATGLDNLIGNFFGGKK